MGLMILQPTRHSTRWQRVLTKRNIGEPSSSMSQAQKLAPCGRRKSSYAKHLGELQAPFRVVVGSNFQKFSPCNMNQDMQFSNIYT